MKGSTVFVSLKSNLQNHFSNLSAEKNQLRKITLMQMVRTISCYSMDLKPVEVAHGNRQDVKILFPVTSPIP